MNIVAAKIKFAVSDTAYDMGPHSRQRQAADASRLGGARRMRISDLYCVLAFCSVVLLLADCNGSTSPAVHPPPSAQSESSRRSSSSPSPIKHVVPMIQEIARSTISSRRFLELTARRLEKPNQTRAAARRSSITKAFPCQKSRSSSPKTWTTNTSHTTRRSTMGKWTVSTRSASEGQTASRSAPIRTSTPTQIRPYWHLAKQYALAEHMFTTQGSDAM